MASYQFARTSPTVVGDVMYLTSGLGRLVCINIKEQKEVWSVDAHQVYGGRNITWGIAENPLVYDGKVITQPGGENAAVVALDAKTGRLVWKSQGLSDKSAYCSPSLLTVDGKRQILTQTENHAVGLNPDTGAVLWKHPHRNQHAVHPNTPVVFDGNKVFISSGYRLGSELLEIKGGEAKVLWKNNGDNHFQGIALYKDRIFSSGGGRMSCFDPKEQKEVYTVEGAKKTSFCITPSGMITYDENGGKVMLVDITPDSAKVVSTFSIGYGNDQHWSSPVVANGVLYLRRGKGVAAFDIAAK
jgi:outer membrane protein assembly factor BamB